MDNKNQNLCGARYSELLAQSNSYNGYMRESAVIELEKFPSEKTINALIERVNDWVPEIRKRAKQVLLRIFKQEVIPCFINNLENIYHLKNCKRDDHSEFINNIEERFIQFGKGALENLELCNSRSALLYSKILKKSRKIEVSALANTCLKHPKVLVRQYAIVLSAKLEAEQKEELLLYCIEDKSGVVRRDALRVLLRNSLCSNYKMCIHLLYDKEKSVRLPALVYLQNNSFNAKEEFREKLMLESVHYQKVAIWGLTEIFEKDSVKLIFPFINSKYPSIRAIAFKALFVLADEDTLDDVFEKAIKDQSPRVVKECLRFYQKCNALIRKECFKEAIREQLEEKNYRFILKMTHKMNKWEQLILLSELSLTENQALQYEIEKSLNLWLLKLNNFFIDPTKKQIEEIKCLGKYEKQHWSAALKNAVKRRISI